MVPAKAGAEGPVAQAQLVLDEDGFFEVGAAVNKREGEGRAAVELGWIGDEVAKVFIEKCAVGLGPGCVGCRGSRPDPRRQPLQVGGGSRPTVREDR